MGLWNEVLEVLKEIGNSKLFLTFLMIIMLDIVAGKCRALKTGTFNSYSGVQGLVKHIVIVLMQTVVSVCGRLMGYNNIGGSLCIFFILDYMVSIYANAKVIGINLPDLEIAKKEVEKKLKSTYGDEQNV